MKLFLIDGNAFCYRAFYAIKGLTNSKGRPTNAVYGFVNMLNKLIKDEEPDYLGIAFDLNNAAAVSVYIACAQSGRISSR